MLLVNRRTFLCGLAGTMAAPVVVQAQRAPKSARIGYLSPSTLAAVTHLVGAFKQEMRKLGYVEGKTFVLEFRQANGQFERLPDLARDLVGLKLDVILATTDVAIAAVKRVTQTIPIVMATSTDPVGTGFVASLAHPGGNITGLSSFSPELGAKRLQMLREAVPGLSRVACFWNPDVRGAVLDYKETDGAAHALRLDLQSVEISRAEDLDRAFSAAMKERAQAFVMSSNPVLFAHRSKIAEFARSNRLPSMYSQREYVDAGGLMSYGPSLPDMYRHAAIYVDKILKGARPGDLPVEQPTKFELVINLKTAKALELTIPQSILVRADEIIQ